MKYLRRYENFDQIDDKYRQKLLEEVGDVYCMIDLLIDHKLVTEEEIYQRSQVSF